MTDLSNVRVERAARLLADYRLARRPFDRFPEEDRPKTEREAYAVQDRLHEILESAGLGPQAGSKIGCTTPVMQEYLKIRNPCAGGLLRQQVTQGVRRFSLPRLLRVGVECELAVSLGADLPQRDAPYTRADVRDAVAAFMAAIEVVEDRYLDYPALDAFSLIADDFFGAACVLGPPMSDWQNLDLTAVNATMSINGRSVGSGTGRDILGHPLEALAWLANNRNGRGRPLNEGEVVILGSLVQTNWVQAGDLVEVANDPFGRVAVEFSS